MNAFVLHHGLGLPVPRASADSGATIPYRTAASIPAGFLLTALVVTTLVLIVLVGCIVYARHRGWLIGSNGKRGHSSRESAVFKTSRRLSMATTLHVVTYGGAEYLIVESTRGSVAKVLPLGHTPLGQGADS